MMQTKTLETISILNFPLALKGNLSIKYRLILKMFWVISVVLAITLFVFYVWQINAEISQKYSIQQDKSVLEKLIKENNVLESQFANSNSLSSIASLVNGLNFEKVEKINYIRALDSQVVKK